MVWYGAYVVSYCWICDVLYSSVLTQYGWLSRFTTYLCNRCTSEVSAKPESSQVM